MVRRGKRRHVRPWQRGDTAPRLPDRERSCTGKVRHPDRAEAVDASRVLWSATGQDKGVYRCLHCGGWHVGGTP